MKSSWDQLLTTVVPDQTLSFSRPKFPNVMTSQSTKFSSSTNEQGGFKSSATFFSKLLSPSVSKEAPITSKNHWQSRYTHAHATLKIKGVSPTLYDDPAFSPDPHANPFFATSHDAWISSPMVGHPTLKKDAQRPPHVVIPPDSRDSGEFRLIQPPNSPMSDDDPPTNASPSPSSHRNLGAPKATVTTAIRSPSVPSSTQSHSASHPGHTSRFDERSRLPIEKSEKKRNPLKSVSLSASSHPASQTSDVSRSDQRSHLPGENSEKNKNPLASVSSSTNSESASHTSNVSGSDEHSRLPGEKPDKKKKTLILVLSSTHSHSTSQTSNISRSDERSQASKEKSEKKRNPLGMFWRKIPPASPTGQFESKHGNEPPPSYETIFSDSPSSVTSISTEARTQSSTDASSLSTQSTMLSADTQSPSASLRPTVLKHRNRKNKLDRIDELDETNPLGIPVHHGGPYEAIPKLVQSQSQRDSPYNVGSQYSISAGSAQSNSSKHMVSSTLYTPSSISLNLSPGQILPRNLDDYYNPYVQSSSVIGTPVPPPPSDSHHRSIPSRKFDPQERWDRSQQQQRWQEKLPGASVSQYPGSPYTRHIDIATSDDFAPPSAATVPGPLIGEYQNMPSRVPLREGHNYHSPRDFNPPNPAPPPPPVLLPAGGHGRYNQGNIVHPSREEHPHDLQRGRHPPTPAPPPPAPLPASEHERYNQNNLVHLSREGSNRHFQHNLHPPVPAPPTQLLAGRYEHYNQSNTVYPSREEYNYDLQHQSHPTIPVPPPPPAHEGHERYNQGSMRHPSREGHFDGSQHDLLPPGISAPMPSYPQAHFPAGGHERYNQNDIVHPSNPELIPRVDVAPPTPAGQSRQLARDRDTQSSRTLISDGSTFNSRSGAMPQPPPHHLPKKLIMPAPLQRSLPVSPRDQTHLLPSQHHLSQQQHFSSRPPSPPSSLQPSFNSAMSRAQEIPMSQGRKLRKKNSVNGLPPSSVHERQVPFSAKVGHLEPQPPAPASVPPKPTTVRRLLSKRRTDL